MALVSPGVQVTVDDQSQYAPTSTSSTPFVLVATASNKPNAAKTGIAPATTAANAGNLYQVTSQRDLVNLYGQPWFYTSSNGTPLQGYELNEYGLLAAYSLLAVTNRCYVLRADIDLASLTGSISRPTGSPDNGTYWLDTTNTDWGIYEFNYSTGKFTLQTPIVITDSTSLLSGAPVNSIGNIGDYAVVALEADSTNPVLSTYKTYYKKSISNEWNVLGGGDWRIDTPTVQGTNSNPTLTAGDTFDIDVSGLFTVTVEVPVSPNDNITGVAAAINALNYAVLYAEVRNNKLCLMSNQINTTGQNYLDLSNNLGTALADIGFTAGTYYQATVFYGTSSQMPLWTNGQTTPRPTGSVWLKMGSAGVGFNPMISEYNLSISNWVSKTSTLAVSDWAAIYSLDATGGKAIPAGTLYAQYFFDQQTATAPIFFFERVATGATVVTGSVTNFNITGGPKTLTVYISLPNSQNLSTGYTITVPNNCDPTDFVTAWTAANIPYTTATVTTTGALQLSHTLGGVIILDDGHLTGGASNGVNSAIGMIADSTAGVKAGPSKNYNWYGLATTGGTGSGLTLDLNSINSIIRPIGTGVAAAGSGYTIGDNITVAGTLLGGTSPTNNVTFIVTAVTAGAVDAVTYKTGSIPIKYTTQLSNWVTFTYTANEGAPTAMPENNTNWYYTATNQVDIMVAFNGVWYGYGNRDYDSNGFPVVGTNTTDPNGPIIAASTPTTQSTGDPLSYGDLWINSSDLENYPVIHRWQNVSGTDTWVLINNTDNVSSSGIVFADARWSYSGAINPVDDPIPSIATLLTSNYTDLDVPRATSYPSGMLLFNTRRSGYNVKQFKTGYFTSIKYPNAGAYDPGDPTNSSNLPEFDYTWVTVSGNQDNNAPYMGRKAQRAMVVKAMRAAISTNTSIRDEDNYFNLMATPNYPELQPNMVELNSARGETCYIIGDTPINLPDSATAIQAWATNEAVAKSTGEDGLVTRSSYMGIFYPSGTTTDPRTGNLVAVPPSHMMLYTFLKNDTISYPWLAAAGTRRGLIYNATQIGYVNSATYSFTPVKTNLGIRDTLYLNQINPLTFFTGVGLLNYGNKSSLDTTSALDRTNVGRLVAYLRRQLTIAARPFVFEPNDSLTRNQIAGVIQTLLVSLKAKRGIYDFAGQCDDVNNPPSVIDRNELYVNVAIEPVKAVEFIYIPVRIYNTGEIATIGR